jgi:hypothetical protein
MSEKRETYTATPALDLDGIEARANAATPAPWGAEHDGRAEFVYFSDCGESIYLAGGIEDSEDADFIAHARTDVPALVAEVRRLRETCDAILTTAESLSRERQHLRTVIYNIAGESTTGEVVLAVVDDIERYKADVERLGRERDDMARAAKELQERLSAMEDDGK